MQREQEQQEQDKRSWMRLAVDAISRTFIIISHAALDEQSQQGHTLLLLPLLLLGLGAA